MGVAAAPQGIGIVGDVAGEPEILTSPGLQGAH